MSQSVLPVRAGDPSTSYEAALKAAMGSSRVRPVILELVKEYGPLTHDELIEAYNMKVVVEPDTPRSSESGIRTRLKELQQQGLVAAADELGHSRFGNAAKRWVAVEPDDPSFAHDLDAMVSYFDDEDYVGFRDEVDGADEH